MNKCQGCDREMNTVQLNAITQDDLSVLLLCKTCAWYWYKYEKKLEMVRLYWKSSYTDPDLEEFDG